MSFRTLYTNGCSMTYGSELNGEDTSVLEEHLTPSQNKYRKEKSWPGVVAARMEVVGSFNKAFGGGSNDRILRTTIRDVLRFDFGPRDLVIIGWTESERLEYQSGGLWIQQTVNVRPDWCGEKRFVDDWARLMLDNTDQVWEKFLTQVLSLQHFLEARNVPYLMFNALPAVTIDEFPRIPKQHQRLKEAIRQDRWITPIDDMHKCMFNQIQHLPQAKGLHPLWEGHQLWGNIVYDFIHRTYPGMVATS